MHTNTHTHTHTHTITQKMETLISLMSDPVVQVQDTAAWTLGRVCDQLPGAALHDSCRDALLSCLASGLEREPRVATNVCWVSGTVCVFLMVCVCAVPFFWVMCGSSNSG